MTVLPASERLDSLIDLFDKQLMLLELRYVYETTEHPGMLLEDPVFPSVEICKQQCTQTLRSAQLLAVVQKSKVLSQRVTRAKQRYDLVCIRGEAAFLSESWQATSHRIYT